MKNMVLVILFFVLLTSFNQGCSSPETNPLIGKWEVIHYEEKESRPGESEGNIWTITENTITEVTADNFEEMTRLSYMIDIKRRYLDWDIIIDSETTIPVKAIYTLSKNQNKLKICRQFQGDPRPTNMLIDDPKIEKGIYTLKKIKTAIPSK